MALTRGAAAQLDCVNNTCATLKYGLGTDPDFRMGKVPFVLTSLTDYNHDDFGSNLEGVSYYHNRGNPNFIQELCGREQVFNPLPGQVILNEITNCTLTEGPKCQGGINAGKSCHLDANNDPYNYASLECPGSLCAESGGPSCRVEIPISDGGKTPPASTSEYWILTLTGAPGFYDLSAMTGNTFGGTSAEKECVLGPTPRKACNVDGDCGQGGTCQACIATNIRRKPSMGTRYLLPEYRRTQLGLAPGATFIRWDKGVATEVDRVANSTAFRLHQDDAAVCCNSPISPTVCSDTLPGFSTYPILWRPTCTALLGIRNLINEDNIVPDWIFAAGRNSRFFTDPEHELPGQQHGVCLNNRDIGCTRPNAASCTGAGEPFACCTGTGQGNCPFAITCTGAGQPFPCCTGANQGSCGEECLGAFPNGDDDVCDFRERGIRIQVQPRQIRNAAGDPVPTACGSALAVLRGAPMTGCTLEPRYPVDGDPSPDCGVLNYGVDHRDDLDCNGEADFPDDKCPFLSEFDPAADADPDCDTGVDADCRGDECECGDANLDGSVNVNDIIQANTFIFSPIGRQRLSDANSDQQTTVSDLVAINTEVFSPDSATCRHITSIRCGNNVRNEGEACDNGARCEGGPTPGAACDASGVNTCGQLGTCQRLGGDGCNPACRVERGWSCPDPVGSPSNCVQVP
jgi:hypothetical protein